MAKHNTKRCHLLGAGVLLHVHSHDEQLLHHFGKKLRAGQHTFGVINGCTKEELYITLGANPLMASGEDLPNGTDALLHYTGLQPGQKYLVLADGASGSKGIFCIQVTEDL